ncbi:MAG: endopeptidase La [Acutalibacteraceae bacterium]
MNKTVVEAAEMTLPMLPLRGLVLFPKMKLHFDIGRKKSAKAIEAAMNSDQVIFIVTQKNINCIDPKRKDVYSVGVVAKVVQIIRQPDDTVRVIVEGICRASIENIINTSSYMSAAVKSISVPPTEETSYDIAVIRSAKDIFERYLMFSPKPPAELLYKLSFINTTEELAYFIAANCSLSYEIKQEILEIDDPTQRLEQLIDYLTQEVYILSVQEDIAKRAKERIDESQREYFLREQLKVIESEIGVEDDDYAETENLREKVLELHLSEENEKTLLKECDRLERMPYGSQEATVMRTYIETCLELPWNTSTQEKIDILSARKTLDENHYGLKKVKENILENLAIRKLSPDIKGQILCLVGPPGVGKTSIAQSVAQAINRKCQRIALGGVKDESEIRGHRRTYIASMPGRIINAIKAAGVNNPVLVLDEIDKLGNDYKGDPTSALLEVLDSEQNNKFYDHYLDMPFDLSKVMFITTANDQSMIPAPLLDRMDVITLDSYTREEKFHIAKEHLIPKQMKNCRITKKMFKISDEAIYMLIDGYTREAGVRSLERRIIELLRKAAIMFVEGEAKSLTVTPKKLEKLIGPIKYKTEKAHKSPEVGIVTGLAWTSVGGETLPIEVAVMNGTGKIELTGSLGDVMQESAKAAVTCIRTMSDKLEIEEDFYKKYDIHIHAPEGAVPKDGPSAGITMATAVASALTKRPVKPNIAMTGEITLRGKVLPIGGLKEKSMAAYRFGVDTVIFPEDNKSDISEIDEQVKNSINFVPVSSISQVLSLALENTKRGETATTASEQ